MRKEITIGILVFILFLIAMILISSITTVPTGFVGVKSRFGAIQETMIGEGLNWKAPFIEKIEKIDCRVQKTEVSTECASKDLQVINIQIAVNYSVSKDKANKLFQEVGKDFKSIIVDPAILEAIKSTTAQYTAEEMITKRSEVSLKMTELLNDKISARGFTIVDFNLINLDFSEDYNKAIEAKQVMEQQAKAAQYDLEKAIVENEKKVANAEADAKVRELQNASITEKSLDLKRLEIQEKAISKWSGNYPTTMIGGDNSIPLIQINP